MLDRKHTTAGELATAANHRKTRGGAALRAFQFLAFTITLVAVVAASSVGYRLYEENRHYRSAAEKVRRDANVLVDFILSDLRDRLQPIGRTDLLELAARRAWQYLESIPAQDDTLEYRQRRAVALDNIGDILLQRGDLSEATRAFRESLAISEALAREDTSNSAWQRNLAVAYSKIADLNSARGQFAEALDSQRRGLAILDHLVQESPDDRNRQYDLSLAHERMGAILEARDELGDALKAYQQRQIIISSLCTSHPERADWQKDLAVSYGAIGNVRMALGDPEGALAAYRKFAELAGQLAAREPSRADFRHDFAISQEKIGDILAARGDHNGAAAAYRQFADLSRELAGSDSQNIELRRDLAAASGRLAAVHERMGRIAEAAQLQQEGANLLESVSSTLGTDAAAGELGAALARLAWYQLLLKQPQKAAEIARRAAKLAPDDRKTALVLAHALLLSGHPAEAETMYRMHQSSTFDGTRRWNSAVSDDFRTLASRGIVHPQMKRIEGLLDSKPR